MLFQIIYILTHFYPLILSTTDKGVLKYATTDVCIRFASNNFETVKCMQNCCCIFLLVTLLFICRSLFIADNIPCSDIHLPEMNVAAPTLTIFGYTFKVVIDRTEYSLSRSCLFLTVYHLFCFLFVLFVVY